MTKMETFSLTNNVMLLTDSYKPSHWKQYPPGTASTYAFFESRGGEFPEQTFFGLQYLIKKYLMGIVITQEKIDEAEELLSVHFGRKDIFNKAGFEYILKEHGGRLPVRIKSVLEGTVVPTRNVLMTVENTDQRNNMTSWLPGYLETVLSLVWYPTTVATQSREMKKTILKYLNETGDPNLIPFKLHDFGFRGSTSVESAGIGGAAHLVNFLGSDTIEALRVARSYYHENMAGFSIPAAEHSTITSWRKNGEALAYANMLNQFPNGLVAVVSDSYDVYNAVANIWGQELRSQVLSRDGTLVVRPDSGEPKEVVVKILDLLGQSFGYTLNNKGYKVLDPHVRVIQGDGINRHSLPEILEAMKVSGWSADNVAFGSGGGLLQNVNRDTSKFAIKCAAANVDGSWRDVYKDPITDPGKRSKAGRMKLVKLEGQYKTVAENFPASDELQTVFENGDLILDQKFSEIRERANVT
jgi:nicotinamide phosphoribosyltransferase